MKKRKILLSTLISSVILAHSKIYAKNVGGLSLGEDANSTVMNAGGKILGLAQIVGVGVATIMLVVLAIKYMSSAPGDKAEIKKHAVVYVVGAILIYAASGVLAILQAFAEGMAD
jgi:preprotein translocase subunit SecG